MPGEDRLRRADAVRGRDLHDDGMLLQVVAMAQRAPTLHQDPLLPVVVERLLLRKVRVHLDLVDHRGDPGLGHQPLDVLRQEVGEPDVPHQATLPRLDQRPPRLHVQVDLRVRPVDQIQVDPVQTGAEHTLLDGGQRLVVAVVPPRQLRGDDQLVPHVARRTSGPADRALVLVVHRRVDQPIARPDRLTDRVDTRRAVQPVRAEPDRRQSGAVGCRQLGNRHG